MPTREEPEYVYVENDSQSIVEVIDSPPGPKGDKGSKGDAATIAIGTTTTVPNGTPANVANAGSASAAVLNFTIPAGPIGPQGPPASDAASLVWDQVSPSSTWHINHNLDYYPNVTVVDSSGSDVVGSVSYVDRDNLVLTFGAAFGGKAYLS